MERVAEAREANRDGDRLGLEGLVAVPSACNRYAMGAK